MLGPVLFAIFMRPIASLELDGAMVVYADDLTLIEPVSKQSTSSGSLPLVIEWINANGMRLNLAKTKTNGYSAHKRIS